jgi:hypothetical protein
MTQGKFNQVCMECVMTLKTLAPYDTGNLSINAIKYEWIDENTFKIYVDQSIAPYMPYTNEPWISPRWNGKKNPNEKWWQNAIAFIEDTICEIIDGELEND